MKKADIQKHKYLRAICGEVNSFLANPKTDEEKLPHIIVSFCVATEKILKIKLHEKNPVLIFRLEDLKRDNFLLEVVLAKEGNLQTEKITTIINRFRAIFPKLLSEEEAAALRHIYNLRNCFVHSHTHDQSVKINSEDIVKKMGAVWERIRAIGVGIFHQGWFDGRGPVKKYSEEELENALESEVAQLISPTFDTRIRGILDNSLLGASSGSLYPRFGRTCPRCGSRGFSQDRESGFLSSLANDSPVSVSYYDGHMNSVSSNLFRCGVCHLELTERQYEIAKKIKHLP